MTTVTRRTSETEVTVELGGGGRTSADTTLPFLDHMLVTLARYSDLSLAVHASGDLDHHIAEDVALTLAEALRQTVPDRAARYGSAVVPMDDALVEAVLDVGGRPYYAGTLPDPMFDHFFRSLASAAGITLHIDVRRGQDHHHVLECAVKAIGLALRQALRQGDVVFSTKGSVSWDVQP